MTKIAYSRPLTASERTRLIHSGAGHTPAQLDAMRVDVPVGTPIEQTRLSSFIMSIPAPSDRLVIALMVFAALAIVAGPLLVLTK